jgi:hypothetical protein
LLSEGIAWRATYYTLPLGWVHVAVTFRLVSGSSYAFYYYVNGKPITELSFTNVNTLTGECCIGGYPQNNRYFNGMVDDTLIHNRLLNPSEIKLLSTRRGIAYERAPIRSYNVSAGAPPVENRRNNMLVGCGF